MVIFLGGGVGGSFVTAAIQPLYLAAHLRASGQIS